MVDVTAQRHSEQDPGLTWFSTSYGSFLGRWRGQKLVRLGHTLDVELDFDYCAWTTPAVASSQGFEVTDSGDQVDALVEQVREDGVVALRVGDDVVLYEPTSALEAEMVGTTIRLSAVRIEVFPTGPE